MSRILGAGSTRLSNINENEVINLDSDEDEDQSLPQNSQLSFASRSSLATTDIIELDDSSDDDDYLDPARALSLALTSAGSSQRPQGILKYSEIYDDLETSTSVTTKKRKNGSESGGTRKKRRTLEESTRDKELRAREKEAAKQRKKDEKEAERQRLKAAKAQEKLAQQAEKLAHKRYLEANKVVTDKKSTLVNCTVEVSSPTELHPVFGQWLRIFANKLHKSSSRLSYVESICDFPYVMRCKRRVDKVYDEQLREWQPVDVPYQVVEPMIALFYTAEDLMKKLQSHHDQAMEDIGTVKMTIDDEFMRLGANSHGQRASKDYQVFVIITGVQTYCKNRPKEFAEAFQAFSIRANVHHRAHVLTSETRQDLAQKLYDISADLGVKPYKLIRASHLPYVSDTAVKSGSTSKDTYTRMLQEIYKFTEPVATAVASTKPSLNQLMLSYDQVGDQPRRDRLFENVVVHRRNKTAQSFKPMNVSLSKRLHKVAFGLNPYAFVGPDTAADMHN